MTDNRWISLLKVNDRSQAEIIQEALQALGIESTLFQEGISHFVYPTTVGPISTVEICVLEYQFAAARAWLEEYQNNRLESLGRQPIPEFEERRKPTLVDMVILVNNNGMGRADLSLQHKLFAKYLWLLYENGELPKAICFYTEGVNLVAEGSPVLGELKTLENVGVRLLVCATCLEYFGLTDKLRVGIIGSMADILEAQLKAGKVITL